MNGTMSRSVEEAGDLPVLIIGAGPTGLALGCMLRRQGVPFRLIDEAEGPSLWSKAQVIHARTLEVFSALGSELIDGILREGRKVHTLGMQTQAGQPILQMDFSSSRSKDTAYPFMLNLSQRRTEELLAEHLLRLGGRIERRVKLLSFTQDDSGVVATLQDASGQTFEQRSRWIVGCDGSHSTVRKILGIAFSGATYEWRITQADVRIDWPFDVAEDEMIGFVSPEGACGAFPLPGERRYRLMAFDSQTEPTLENFQALLDTRGPKGARVSDPAWMVQFTIHCRMVEHYRQGSAFLVGDAAHIHSPAGGQGMNTGIQDAYNLAWKLGLCHAGLATSALLDSYHAERHPVAAAVLRGTDAATIGMSSLLKLKNPLAQGMRNHLLRFVTSLGFVQGLAVRTLSQLDVAYNDSPITGQDRHSLLSTKAFAGKESEEPSLLDYFAFGEGPVPGQRVPDMDLPGGGRLHGLLASTKHTLLLFDGAAKTEAGYQNLLQVREAAHGRLLQHGQVVVVIAGSERPKMVPADVPVIFDNEGTLHKIFGARSECLYLVRPDGYVGYRCQPAVKETLLAYLDRLLQARIS